MTVTSPPATGRWTPRRVAIWAAIALLGAVAWGVLALARGESINAAWLIVAALCSCAIAYRFYARFIAHRVLGVDDRRATPAERLDQDLRLSRERRRGRLVETPHPHAEVALADQRLPLERQPDHLELRHAEPPA